MFEFKDLTGQQFGLFKVLAFDHMEYHGTNHKHGMSYYKCECQKCHRVFIKARSDITQSKGVYHSGCKAV